jgi:WD40 repeat protein
MQGRASRLIVPAVLAVCALAGASRARADGLSAEIVPQLGHSSAVESLVLSANGRLALSGSTDHTMILWDVASGSRIREFRLAHSVSSVAISPDGKSGLSAADTLSLWDLTTGRAIREFPGSEGSGQAAFSPDGKTALADRYDNTLKIWDLATGTVKFDLRGHSARITSLSVSPDGKIAVSASRDKTVKVWDLATGRQLWDLKGHAADVTSVAVTPDGKFVLSGSKDKTLKLWNLTTGDLVREIVGPKYAIRSVAILLDGKTAVSNSSEGIRYWGLETGLEIRRDEGPEHVYATGPLAVSPTGRAMLFARLNDIGIVDLASGHEVRTFNQHATPITSVAISPSGTMALSGDWGPELKLWDLTTGRVLRVLSGHRVPVDKVNLLPDGRSAWSRSDALTSDGMAPELKLWDVGTGRVIRDLAVHGQVVFSADGKSALSWRTAANGESTLETWNLVTGEKLKDFSVPGSVYSISISPDGRTALVGKDRELSLWDLETAQEIRTLKEECNPNDDDRGVRDCILQNEVVSYSADGKQALAGGIGTARLWDLTTGRLILKLHQAGVITLAIISPDGKLGAVGDADNGLKIWNLATGTEVRDLKGHTGRVSAGVFAPDGKRLLSGSWDGSLRVWDLQNGKQLAAMVASKTGGQLSMSPEGFFSASGDYSNMLAIVRGLDVTAIGQVHQSLYNPDLMREALAGDAKGEVRRAGEVMNLGKVLDSGPAPQVEIASHAFASATAGDLVAITARIEDRGRGIGRTEWRVNGITVGVTNGPGSGQRVYEARRELALDPGENVVEVVAYNRGNLLASLPARTRIALAGATSKAKPNLYVLAIGINKYVDRGGKQPGTDEASYFPPLALAVADATAFAQEMKKAGRGVYRKVLVRTALDEQAARDGLDRIVEEIGAEIQPRDTFVLFAAAHGYSTVEDGRFYLIPQDYQGGADPAALASRAVGQERLQDWIANRIKAKKALVLLDTCRSGALIAGYERSRIDERPSEAGIGRLHEATGRPVLTAAAAGEDALEVQKLGHGVFTAALIGALHHGDTNNDGLIEVSELAAYVQWHVPRLADGSEVRAAVAQRGLGDGDQQSAHFGSTGGDFALVKQLP